MTFGRVAFTQDMRDFWGLSGWISWTHHGHNKDKNNYQNSNVDWLV